MNIRFAIEYGLMPNGIRAYVPIGIWAHSLDARLPDAWAPAGTPPAPDAEVRFLPGHEGRAAYANEALNTIVEVGVIPEEWLENEAEAIGDYVGAFGKITDTDQYATVPELLDAFELKIQLLK